MDQLTPREDYLDVVPTLPAGAPRHRPADPARTRREALRDAAVRWGLREVITPVFADPVLASRFGGHGAVLVDNPLKSVTKALRTSVLPGMLATVRSNLPRVESADLVELGVVALPAATGGASEHHRLGVVLWRRRARHRTDAHARRDVADAVATILRTAGFGMPEFVPARPDGFGPAGGAEVLLGGRVVGVLGIPDPAAVPDIPRFARPAVAELDVDALTALTVRPAVVRPAPPGQPVELDVTVAVPVAVPSHQVVAVLAAGFEGAAERLTLVDEYDGRNVEAGHRAVTVRVWLAVGGPGSPKAAAATLRDRAVDTVRAWLSSHPAW